MLFIYDKSNKVLHPSEETDFETHRILERKDVEKWVMDYPEILGEELLVVTTEYDKFDRTRERLDLILLDKNGKIVIVELKRGVADKTTDLQAIKYASYCSRMRINDIVQLRKKFLAKSGIERNEEEVKNEIFSFIANDDFEELDDKPRIILVATDFKPEVATPVLWLREFGVDVSCIRLSPYRIDDNRIGFVSSTLIPTPGVEEYVVGTEGSQDTPSNLTRKQEEYVKFYGELIKLIKGEIPSPLPEPSLLSYYQIRTRINGVHFEWGFHGRPRSSFGVELHFEKGNKDFNRDLLKEMQKYKDDIERETGEKVIFQEDWGKVWARLYLEKNEGRMTDELKEWAVEKMIVLYKLLEPKLQ